MALAAPQLAKIRQQRQGRDKTGNHQTIENRLIDNRQHAQNVTRQIFGWVCQYDPHASFKQDIQQPEPDAPGDHAHDRAKSYPLRTKQVNACLYDDCEQQQRQVT